MKIDVLTIFPKMFEAVLKESILRRAQEKGLVKICVHNLRDWSKDKHKKVDDRPFGGGPGMVMRVEPIFSAVEELKKDDSRVLLLSPQGKRLTQDLALQLAKFSHIIMICGHYEGVDERVRKFLVTEEISIGDYVLSCGELPAMVLIDCMVRLIPGVLGHQASAFSDSFMNGLLEYPQYTRPANFRGMKVPEILLSGDHKKIELWRKSQALKKTRKNRPDLLISDKR